MSLHYVTSIIAVIIAAGGCTNVDGVLLYDVDGTLLDPNGTPIAGVVVVPSRHASLRQGIDISKATDLNPGYTHTDVQGRFRYNVPAGSWGYTLLCDAIPVGNTMPPQPPLTDWLYVHVQTADGWRSVRCDSSRMDQEEASPGLRRIHLGNVIVSGSVQRPP